MASCPYHALRGFFSIYAERLAASEQENSVLTLKTKALESLLETMRREIDVFKFILGAWIPPQPLAGRVEIPSTLDAYTLESLTPLSDPSADSATTQTRDDLASYFPTPSNLVPSPLTGYSSRSETLHHSSRSLGQLPWDQVVSSIGLASRPLTTVAPLDLSGTLTGSLAGLHRSVVSLADSIDALGRRNDLALTNETLRLNEEILSIRASIHGLRMQV